MSEEDKIIDRVMMIDQWKVAGDIYTQDELNAIGELLDLYIAEKEKNKELENCLQMAKQIMTADISEDFDCMKLKEFKEYLLNEIKLNENFEE